MNKVALYCRVSTNDQDTANQELRLIDYAKERNLNYDLYKEVESTRKTRPIKQEMLSRLRKKEYDAVIVYKLDRYARSSAELILEVKELFNKGVAFISISESLDFSTASGKLHFQILSAFAEFERELIRERTIEGLKRVKIQGSRLGRPKGAKDSKPRRKSGYIIREAKKRQSSDEVNGNYLGLDTYIEKSSPK
ncbi:MAG: recombinase family protein [Bacteroidota bacterium]|nr:recombinase family protein [Bacteroidota bacterium]